MKLNPTCSMPLHNDGNNTDKNHPLYPIYRKWAAALRAQLVVADSFEDWLRANKDRYNLD